MMFKLSFDTYTQSGVEIITARATTLEGALGLINEFFKFGFVGHWEDRDGRYVAEICDWIDLWFADPPVRARIVGPRGFTPPDAGLGFARG